MLNEKIQLPTWAAILIGLIAALTLGFFIGNWTAPVPSNKVIFPGPQTRVVKMQPEDSREAWRQYRYSADGAHLLEVEIAYNKTKRHNHMFFSENGNVSTVTSYADGFATTPDFTARYDTSGRHIVYSQQHNPDGTVQVWQGNDDGTSTIQVHRANGTLSCAILHWSDGSRVSTVYGADGTTILSESMVKPEPHTVLLGSWNSASPGNSPTPSSNSGQPDPTQPAVPQTDLTTQSSDPTSQPTTATPAAQQPKFKVYMQGTRTLSWDYLDSDGNVVQHGTFQADQSVTIEFYNTPGVIAFRQHWQMRFEDWNRKFYALERVDEYYDGGQSIFRQLVLGSNQHTVRESRLFHPDGTAYQLRYYDESGNLVFSDNFDDNGVFANRTPQSTQWSSSEYVNDSLVQQPSDAASQALYNLRGTAYADLPLAQTGAVTLDPLFISASN